MELLMAALLHEIWETLDEHGQTLPACCLTGPDGDAARQLLTSEPGARLVCTFEAESHYEAMTIYHRLLGLGTYTTEHVQDMEPYPDAWLRRQLSGSSGPVEKT
jgi:hypothetical protein